MGKIWLLKTEPGVYSIDDLKKDKITYWDGLRNYQARNYLREMKKGERVLIYHSNDKPPGIVGLATVAKSAFPDPSQFDKRSDYFDPKASADNPRWFCPDIKFVEKFRSPITLPELKKITALSKMVLLKQGSRLSVQPVSGKELEAILGFAAENRSS